jgi:hypothetical protein
MILYYYGESSEDSSIRDHLDSCGSCRSEYQNLQRSLAVVTADSVPERPADYGSRVWHQVQSQLRARRRFSWAVLWPFQWSSSDVGRRTSDVGPRTSDVGRRTLWAGSVVAVLIVGAFLLGRYWPHPQPPAVVEQATPVSLQAREQVLLSAIADHLEQSQLVLMEIAHSPEGGEVDIAASQAIAREALKANRIYKQAAARNGEPGLASILDDLELILLDIVHSPSTVSPAQIDEIRLRIQAQEILFKLRVLGSRVRERQKDAARELSRRSS